ncbi:unnamed protein product, partial [Choristocarpus tenellus]
MLRDHASDPVCGGFAVLNDACSVMCCLLWTSEVGFLAMTGLKGSNDEVDAILPVKSYPVPTLS